MKILPQAGDLVRPVFLELVQTTGTDTTYCRTTYGCGIQPMVVFPAFTKNGKFWKKYVSGNVRVYYYNVNKESKNKYDNIITSIRIRKL